MKNTTIKVWAHTHQLLKDFKKKTNIPISRVVDDAVKMFLKEQSKKYGPPESNKP